MGDEFDDLPPLVEEAPPAAADTAPASSASSSSASSVTTITLKAPADSKQKPQPAKSSSMPLAELYLKCQQTHSKLTGDKCPFPSSSPEYQALVEGTAKDLLRVYKAVRQSGVFSINEEVDDVNTADLQYLLVTFYLGDINLLSNDATKRLSNVKAAMLYLKLFLDQCKQLKLVNKQDEAALTRGPNAKVTPETLRAEKISRFKRKKQLRQKLEVYEKLQTKRRAAKGKALDDDEDEVDDTRRDFLLGLIQASIITSLDHMRSCQQELEMLRMMASGPPDHKEPKKGLSAYRIAAPGQRAQPLMVGGTRVKNINDVIKGAAQVQKQVFRNPNPPSMTLDQWVTQEQKKGNLPMPNTKPKPKQHSGAPNSATAALSDDDEDSEDDEVANMKTYKARAWDNWKDDHQKGAGNTLNR